jgi:hypothetical protein
MARRSVRRFTLVLVAIFSLAAGHRHCCGIDETMVAGIVYNETSGLRAISGQEAQLQKGRDKIAEIAYKRDGKGMAKPKIPDAEELKFPPAKAAWEASKGAAKNAKEVDAKDCIHVFIWPSADKGKTPDKKQKTAGIADWPFDEAAKIKHTYGPINCPKKVGDVPESKTVYIFIYCGVK